MIREAVGSDAAAYISFLNQIASESDFLTFGSADELNLTTKKEESSIENALKRENVLFLIAESEGQIVGNLDFSGGSKSRTAHTGEFGISVLKDYWGKGIGKKLLAELIEWAHKNDVIRKINLRVRTDNPRAIHLYQSFGFEEEGLIKRDFLIDGVFYDSLQMGLLIDPRVTA